MTDHILIERLERWADAGDYGRKPEPTDLRRLAAARIRVLEEALREIVALRDNIFVSDAGIVSRMHLIARAAISGEEKL